MAATERAESSRRRWVRRVLGVVLAFVLGAFVVMSLVNNWVEVRADLGRLPVSALVWSAVFAAVGAICSGGSWYVALNALTDRLPPHDAATIFFAGQLGKYVPGSVWPAMIQAQLGRRHQIARSTMVAAFGVAITVAVGSGGCVGLLTLLDAPPASVWVLAVGTAV
ncbi:MAG: hypothetical protein ACKOYM_06025, partial [Actinomycetes bacterium]